LSEITAGLQGLAPVTRAIIAMVLSTVAFTSMHAAIVFIADDMHPFQIAFFRNLFAVLMLYGLVARGGLSFLRTERLPLHGLRAVLNVVAMLMFFYGLSITPLARVTALSFTAPLFMSVMSVIIFREQLIASRFIALGVGFLGTLVVLRPGFATHDFGSLLILTSAFVWAVTMVVIKELSKTETSLTITGYMALLLSLFSLGPAVMVWTWPDAQTLLLLVIVGAAGTIAQYALAESLKLADATAVMPFDFLKLVWASLFGFLLFGQVPGIATWLGGAVIFSAGLVLIFMEAKAQRRAKSNPRTSARD